MAALIEVRQSRLASADADERNAHAPLSVGADLDDVSGRVPGGAGIKAVGLELDGVELSSVVKAAIIDYVETGLPNAQAPGGQPAAGRGAGRRC